MMREREIVAGPRNRNGPAHIGRICGSNQPAGGKQLPVTTLYLGQLHPFATGTDHSADCVTLPNEVTGRVDGELSGGGVVRPPFPRRYPSCDIQRTRPPSCYLALQVGRVATLPPLTHGRSLLNRTPGPSVFA
jgi:hypothetical protein